MSDSKTVSFHIEGLDCPEEIALLKRALLPLIVEEERLRFDVLSAKLTIDLSSLDIQSVEIISAIQPTGLVAEVWNESSEKPMQTASWLVNRRAILTVICGVFGLLGLLVQVFARSPAGEVPTLAISCYALGIIAGMILVLPKAWRSAISMRPDMNLLMTIAVIGAVLIGEWTEGVTVAFLFSFSLLLESWSIGKARGAIAALMEIAPPSARVRDSQSHLHEHPPSDVAVGSTIVVHPGEKIPLDGRVTTGASSVDQAPITGESMPVSKAIGDDVYAGTINGDGLLEIETTKEASDTTLAKIIKMVGDASSRRAPSEQWVEKFAAIYTPAVLVFALAVMIIPPLTLGQPWAEWFYRALVLLVIACPCALVISTPVSVVAALACSARNGVLIKGGIFMELPARLKAIAMDKTGTLTTGNLSIIDTISFENHSQESLLSIAGSLEKNSNHPLAKSIVQEATGRHLTFAEVDRFELIQGKGATGWIDGKQHWIGSPRFVREQLDLSATALDVLKKIDHQEHSIVIVWNDVEIVGIITLADTVRPEALNALQKLHSQGIEALVMLTGDHEKVAQAVAKTVGIDQVHSQLLPEDKVTAIQTLVDRYENVAMVGDGVNDAPAMAVSSLGIAMGAAGTDAAIETADIALMSDDLLKLPWLVRHSQRTIQIIRQNIGFALGVKLIFVALTFGGFASLWAAILADTGASLLVIFNGLRLLRSDDDA